MLRPLFHQQFNKNKHHKTLASQYHVVSFLLGFILVSCCQNVKCMMRRTDWMLMWIESDPSAVPGSLLPVAVLGLLWHACEWRLQAAQVVVELAGVTQHKQVLILVFLADATATNEVGDVTAWQRHLLSFLLYRILECTVVCVTHGPKW